MSNTFTLEFPKRKNLFFSSYLRQTKIYLKVKSFTFPIKV